MDEGVIETISDTLRDAFHHEVLFVGRMGKSGLVEEISAPARGNSDQVPALFPFMEKGDVVIHNHPSGAIRPSGADLSVASRLGNQGIGFFIVDNTVAELYVVAEPVETWKRENLDIDEIRSIVESGGLLDRNLESYEPRNEQASMLEAVAHAFNDDAVAVIEAGTGVGKSFAYLIPSLQWAKRNRERVIVSTHTINLQHQLYEKDIPVIRNVLGLEIKAVVAKGRGNYLCLRRIEEMEAERELFTDWESELAAIRGWAEKTKEGAKSDLSFYPTEEIWQSVCSESDTCVGLRCAYRERCFVLKARKEAASADLIIVNHHLYFADLSMRMNETGFDMTAVLPPTKRVIFDEAHTMESCATSFFSDSLNRFSLNKQLGRIVRRRGKRRGGLLSRLRKLVPGISLDPFVSRIDDIREKYELLDSRTLTLFESRGGNSFRVTGYGEGEPAADIRENLVELHDSLLALISEVYTIPKRLSEKDLESPEAYELSRVTERLEGSAEFLRQFSENADDPEHVFWIERRRSGKGEHFSSFIITPLEVGGILKESLFEKNDSVVCTSATLTVQKRFDTWMSRVGLEETYGKEVRCRYLESPFPYETNVLLTVPTDAPPPTAGDEYIRFSTGFIGSLLEVTDGRGLVLFTSYSMLTEVYEQVRKRLLPLGITTMRQGEDDRTRLLNRFNTDISSVLFATESFWQGVDAPGETLEIVILCRLPFQVPTDPVVKARMEAVEKRGGNSFFELAVPEAVTKLKQGFGRLMRKKDDRGVVAILDTRILTKGYGKIFLSSLPPTVRCFKEGASILEEIERFMY